MASDFLMRNAFSIILFIFSSIHTIIKCVYLVLTTYKLQVKERIKCFFFFNNDHTTKSIFKLRFPCYCTIIFYTRRIIILNKGFTSNRCGPLSIQSHHINY